jgi:hypothetical protein
MHFVAKEEDVVEVTLEEKSSVDGVDFKLGCKEF